MKNSLFWGLNGGCRFKSDRKITFICYSSICDFTASLTPIIVDKYSKKKTKKYTLTNQHFMVYFLEEWLIFTRDRIVTENIKGREKFDNVKTG